MLNMGHVTAGGAARDLDTFERPVQNTSEPRKSPPKVGFQPRAAVMHSGKGSSRLTNVKVSKPMPGKVMVNATEGYLTGTLEGGRELTIDMYQVYDQYRGRHLGKALIEAAVNECGIHSLRASMGYTNGQALKAAGGDVERTPFGKAARALGFQLVDQEGSYFIYAK